jgi:ArsR family transcriptional regulator, arsenate/arsenite/antimonite-responsive transcriptional repressor
MIVCVLKELPVVRQRGTCCELPAVDPAWAESTSGLLKAIADPTRLTMLAALWKADAPVCICDFTGSLELSQPTISHHMGKLREAGLVKAEKNGIWIYYRLSEGLPSSTRQVLAQLLGSMK